MPITNWMSHKWEQLVEGHESGYLYSNIVSLICMYLIKIWHPERVWEGKAQYIDFIMWLQDKPHPNRATTTNHGLVLGWVFVELTVKSLGWPRCDLIFWVSFEVYVIPTDQKKKGKERRKTSFSVD